jgi:hypothetical protein
MQKFIEQIIEVVITVQYMALGKTTFNENENLLPYRLIILNSYAVAWRVSP